MKVLSILSTLYRSGDSSSFLIPPYKSNSDIAISSMLCVKPDPEESETHKVPLFPTKEVLSFLFFLSAVKRKVNCGPDSSGKI
jgi:hypothetical protein